MEETGEAGRARFGCRACCIKKNLPEEASIAAIMVILVMACQFAKGVFQRML